MAAIKSERELAQLKAAFLAIISHELRTPLTEIMGAASLLSAGYLGTLNEKQREYLTMIESSASHLNVLIQDLLSFAQLQSQTTELLRVPVTLAEIGRDALALHRAEAAKKNLLVITDLDTPLPPLPLDRVKMTRVVSNLISNAINFTPEGGRIMVRTRGRDGGQMLDVADTGVGIPQEKRANIFDSFYQTEDPLTRTVGGLGIGLAYARQIVEAHRGRIGVESIKGRGSLFTIWLPESDNAHSMPVKN
jgi:signal transduction histidine kinase